MHFICHTFIIFVSDPLFSLWKYALQCLQWKYTSSIKKLPDKYTVQILGSEELAESNWDFIEGRVLMRQQCRRNRGI